MISDPLPKRPASHWWALICFVAMAAVNLILMAKGHFDPIGILVTLASLAGIFSFVFLGRSPRAYAIGFVALGFALLRGMESLFFQVLGEVRGRDFGGWQTVAGVGWMLFLLVILFRAYTFGSRSRAYYGLSAPPRSEPPKP